MGNDIELAKLKKDLFVGIINMGSNNQKERALDVTKEVYDWCVCHIRHDEEEVISKPRRGRPKKTDTQQ